MPDGQRTVLNDLSADLEWGWAGEWPVILPEFSQYVATIDWKIMQEGANGEALNIEI